MIKRDKLEFYPDRKVFVLNGKTYKEKTTKLKKKIDGITHVDKVIFEEVDMDKENERMGFLISRLSDAVPKERMIEEFLNQLPPSELKKMEKIFRTKEVKIKRHDGCLGLKIDGGKHNSMYLELFD